MPISTIVRSAIALGLVTVLGAPVAFARGQEPPRRVVRITAERFTFSPSQVRVKRGTLVEFRVHSDDTDHGFRIVDTDASAIVPKRGRGDVAVTFLAETPGRYVFECYKPCGAGHTMMRGVIIVEE